MNTNTTEALLAQVRIASPCSARWADMAGDERARFCGQCQKRVYHLSAMTADEAAALIREKEGNLCVRFYQRSDGTVLTADCPVGARRVSRRLKRLVLAAVPLLVAAAAFSHWACGNHEGRSAVHAGPTLSQRLDAAVWRVKGWLGITPAVMGGMCPPPASPPPSPTGGGA